MKLSFLEPLYARPGPYACAYVDTSRDVEDPETANDVRRRHVRDDLAAQGADTATVAAVAAVIGADRAVPGRHGQAVFAAHGRLALVAELPDPPVRDLTEFTSLPDAMPLAVQHAPDIPYTAVVVHRVDHRGESGLQEELQVDLETGRWPISRVTPGTHSRRRFPVVDWQRGVAQVAGELGELADRGGAEVIVVCGEVWARAVLLHRLPRRLSERVVVAEGGAGEGGEGRALLEEELVELFRGRMAVRDRAQAETFMAHRARYSSAAEGMAATVAALQRGQARSLLINERTIGERTESPARMWTGPEPTHIALSPGDLRSFGVTAVERQPADAALIRAAVGTGAELVVVPPQEEPRLADGVGVLLRYSDTATTWVS
ncbi:baeRF2 domain-containing protein [Streptomyces sp. NPDC002577]